jgi:S1-C subfamily serine protease
VSSLLSAIRLAGLVALLGAAPLAQPQDGGIAGLRQTSKAFASVAKKVAPAVAFIQVEGRAAADAGSPSGAWPFQDDLFRRFFGEDFPGLARPAPRKPQRTLGQGSGFVFAEDGRATYLLTNHHVVERAQRIRVRFQDGREFDASIRGTDPCTGTGCLDTDLHIRRRCEAHEPDGLPGVTGSAVSRTANGHCSDPRIRRQPA